ncbi:uncharacterized protein LOC136085215 [Hydra vulgaris]|uniref:Uncharacterized protein LOC136085215 n=1 Tax=Hydra vulgaris TaxID=6087 RepID=A0ABM4CLA7_HYDVU
MEFSEIKIFRFSFGVTKKNRIRNEFIRGSAHVACFGDKVRESRLRWFEHVQRKQESYIGRKVLGIELLVRGGEVDLRGGLWIQCKVVEGMRVAGVSVENTHDMAK